MCRSATVGGWVVFRNWRVVRGAARPNSWLPNGSAGSRREECNAVLCCPVPEQNSCACVVILRP